MNNIIIFLKNSYKFIILLCILFVYSIEEKELRIIDTKNQMNKLKIIIII